MITNVIILVLLVVFIAIVVNLIGEPKEARTEAIAMPVDNHKDDTTERLENSLGTLSDRAVAARQYQMMKNSFEENCLRDPESASMITNQVRDNFEQMAKQLATIGTNVSPEDVDKPLKDGLPLGWDLK